MIWRIVSSACGVLLCVGLIGLAAESHTSDLLGVQLLFRNDPFAGMSVVAVLAVSILRSAVLVAVAIPTAIFLGVALATRFMLTSNRLERGALLALGGTAAAFPPFIWAMLLNLVVFVVYSRTGFALFPLIGGFGVDAHLVAPAITLAVPATGIVFRLTAVALTEASESDFARTALAKGLSHAQVLRLHLLPSVRWTVIDAAALAAQVVLSSLLIVEFVFNWQGAGYAFLDSLVKARYELAAALLAFFVLPIALTARVQPLR